MHEKNMIMKTHSQSCPRYWHQRHLQKRPIYTKETHKRDLYARKEPDSKDAESIMPSILASKTLTKETNIHTRDP